MEADLGGGDAAEVNAAAVRRRTVPAALPTTFRLSPDVLGVGALLLLTAIVAWEHLAGGGWAVLRLDAVVFFTPMWGFLGEQLRVGNIPGWNPHQFGGMPFAGDPESGWMYLPVMVAAVLLPALAAFKAVVVFHLALAGLATYGLGRVLGMGVLASLVAGTAYEFGALLEYMRCCTPFAQIGAWLPVALLGVELALRAGAWLPRVAWWGLAGLAVSQMLGGWLGQGAYYGLLMVGGFLAYRAMLVLVGPLTLQDRLVALVMHGAAVFLLGFGLAAAGVLPRLEAISRSTLADGSYAGLQGEVAGPSWWTLPMALDFLLSIEAVAQRYYAGGATLALALLAPLLARRHFAVPFFAVTSAATFVLTLHPTPLHRLFGLLPRFETLHGHYPERVLVVGNLGLALLAGATVATLPRWRHVPLLAVVGAVPAFALVLATPRLERSGLSAIATSTVVAVGLVALLVAVAALWWRSWLGTLLPIAFVLLVFADPAGWSLVSQREFHRQVSGESADLYAAYGGAGGAAGFLLAQHGPAPTRYAGYDAGSMEPVSNAYFRRYRMPLVPHLLLNNRATTLALYDLSGYNPVQPRRFRTVVDTMNWQGQDYHQTNLLLGGVDSPLLDLLNVRYIVVPAAAPPERTDLHLLNGLFPTVYLDMNVRVLENREALPPAWLVHNARKVDPGQALPELTFGSVDPTVVALVEADLPALDPPAEPTVEYVAVTTYTADRIELVARTGAPGLVVLSESYDPGWRAYVNGEPAPMVVANHALRAVPVQPGAHTIELRYEPRSLTVGLAISLGTAGMLAGSLALLGGARWRERRRPSA